MVIEGQGDECPSIYMTRRDDGDEAKTKTTEKMQYWFLQWAWLLRLQEWATEEGTATRLHGGDTRGGRPQDRGC